MQYTLRQLQVFLAIAKVGNLTKAAKELNLSQSAASSALKDLETQFEILLFDRIGKRLHLNEQGAKLRPRAESLMEQAYELERSLQKSDGFREVKVGATLTIANCLALEMVSSYLKKYTGASISLDIHNTEHIVDQVINYELDMGMIEGETHHSQLSVDPWKEDELFLFCNKMHPLASKKEISDDDLLNIHWILREPGSGTRQTFDRAMHGLMPEMQIILELRETEAIKSAVKHNIGVGCLSRLSLQAELQRGEFVRLHLPQRNLGRKFYLITHKQKYMTGSLQNWLNLCNES